MYIKVKVSDVRKVEKDDKTFYFVKVKDDVYVQELSKFVGGVSLFADEATYNALIENGEAEVRFSSKNGIKLA